MLGKRRRRKGGMATIAELVPRVLSNEPDDAIFFRVMALWERSFPHRMVKNARPTSLHKGVLSVWVKTSAWMQELRLLKDRVIADINAALGDPPAVTDLKLHFGAARIVDGDPLARLRVERDRRRPPAPRRPTPAPPAHAAEIAQVTALVDDPELAAIIGAVRTRWDR